MERPRAARRWNHREPTNASRRRWSELRGRLEAKKVSGGLLFLVSAGSFASLKMANEPGRRFPGSFVVPHVPPYRLTALPPYRLTALPPYRCTQLARFRLPAISPSALAAVWISGREWKPLLKLGPQPQSTDAQTYGSLIAAVL